MFKRITVLLLMLSMSGVMVLQAVVVRGQGPAAQTSGVRVVLIKAGRLIDVKAGRVLTGQAILIEADRIKKPAGCIICGEESAPISTEGLCWVCRRLKLSAWRDSDTQMTAQE